MTNKHKIYYVFYIISGLLFFSNLSAMTKAQYESKLLTVKISTNAPQSISAFYEARGFQKKMLDILRQHCFVSVFIRNKSKDFIWLNLSQWKLTNADGEITRLDRNYWKAKWQTMDIPLAHQSIFRWTLIPEQLDFHPNEREGGNIILPRLDKPFNITATFPTKADKQGSPITINFNNIECANNK